MSGEVIHAANSARRLECSGVSCLHSNGNFGGLTAVVESELLGGQPVKAPNVVYVKTPVQLVQVIQQERGAIGFAQLALVRERGIPELVTERPIEQTLSFITLGEPTPAMRTVVDATRRVVGRAM